MPKYSTLPYPNGWFAACFSHELQPGAVLSRRFCDRDVVVFRTESGAPAIIDAHCPHMGAHMGVGGRVEGEAIRCPFHGFRFAPDGACVSTPYGSKIPPKCTVPAWQVREKNGIVLFWYHQHHMGAPPSFEVPEYDLHGWVPLVTKTFTVSTHPQETSENSVDLGHLAEVHGYRELAMLDDLQTDGPYLTACYAMSRFGFGPSRRARTRSRFRVHVHGLGFSHVECHVEDRDIHLRYWVLCTPTRDDKCELRAAASVKLIERPSAVNPALALLPRALATRLVQQAAFHEFCHDLQQDFDIWEHKRYVDPPVLAKGDGPVGLYRKWCRQFYAQFSQVREAV